jgi:hypothetical protein
MLAVYPDPEIERRRRADYLKALKYPKSLRLLGRAWIQDSAEARARCKRRVWLELAVIIPTFCVSLFREAVVARLGSLTLDCTELVALCASTFLLCDLSILGVDGFFSLRESLRFWWKNKDY